jgi:Xaa-Pro aminopeptidase
MNISPPPYSEDALRTAIAKAVPGCDLDAVIARLQGVAAAPENFDLPAQRSLILGDVAADLDALLGQHIGQLTAAYDSAVQPGDRDTAEQRLAALRANIEQRNLTGFLVPRVDEHLGEYVARNRQRLAWLTGFTGSAGTAIVLKDKAALFVDGRYTVQAPAQTSKDLYAHLNSADTPPSKWLKRVLSAGDRLGYDPWLHTPEGVKSMREAATKVGAELVAVATNPVDEVWPDQPQPPLSPVIVHGLKYAGESSGSKRKQIAETLRAEGADAVVLTAPDSIAWLLNIRGGDLPHTPVALGFAILHSDETVDLFMNRDKFSENVAEHLGSQVRCLDSNELGPTLDALGGVSATVRLDPAGSVAWLFDRLEAAGATVARADDPCAAPKAAKNQVEIAGMRACHIRDGAALTRFIAWVTEAAPKGSIDELTAAKKAEEFRAQVDDYRDLSFGTISAAGPNAALPHYSATAQSNHLLKPGTLFLLDSGCQYPDGTTDVTRTIAIGAPTAEHRDRFTRVLKGHIAVSTSRFPKGTSGSQLDAFARRPLWDVGLDYDHGTGHGVGAYLSVHEGPQRISKMPAKVALEPGMVISNEPGFYKVGDFGIRIENLIEVTAIDPENNGGLLSFQNLTCAPIDLNLVDRSLLTDAEVTWLNGYHAWVREQLTPLLDAGTNAWLKQATRAL